MKRLAILILSVLFFTSAFNVKFYAQQENKIQLNDGWKFALGDNLDFTNPTYDDSKWEPIKVDKIWEDQGHTNYDGFAWYRIKVMLPSSLKEKSFLKDSLKIFLGKIDDFDQSFINGKIFGVNGQTVPANKEVTDAYKNSNDAPWDKDRRYVLSVNDPRILWDKENVIAVRVYDHGGGGGIYSGGLYISMIHLPEYLESNAISEDPVISKSKISKRFYLKNSASAFSIIGKFSINAENTITKKNLFSKSSIVDLAPSMSKDFAYSFGNENQPVTVWYKFEFTKSGESTVWKEVLPYILTPRPYTKPKINGAKVYGERPGKPFQYTIAATGVRPMIFEAKNLPQGLSLNQSTGIITGVVSEKADYYVTLIAKNKFGADKSELKIVIGDQIALTPPMGWNSWNCWGLSVTQSKVLASAKVFKEKGLMNHGWTYINIDDGWEIFGRSDKPKRDSQGKIIVNEKFPNMKELGDSIHALGLKFGIYSSPGPLTCGGYTASYQHELQDAESYASWGIDYLKYDWCSYGGIAKDNSLPELKKPYFVMREALNKIDRDIVYSLCQYGMGDVWEWGNEVGGNLWRTTGDINDKWLSVSRIGFSQHYSEYAEPGHWNDPDMLVIGKVGWDMGLRATKLTPDEQYTHVSLWCLLSAPLMIGCDLTELDDFTLSLLTNDEVLEVDQDILGKQAAMVAEQGDLCVYSKPLEDGSIAVGLINKGTARAVVTANWPALKISGKQIVRDLWRQKDLGAFIDKFESEVAPHGVVFVKIKPSK